MGESMGRDIFGDTLEHVMSAASAHFSNANGDGGVEGGAGFEEAHTSFGIGDMSIDSSREDMDEVRSSI